MVILSLTTVYIYLNNNYLLYNHIFLPIFSNVLSLIYHYIVFNKYFLIYLFSIINIYFVEVSVINIFSLIDGFIDFYIDVKEIIELFYYDYNLT